MMVGCNIYMLYWYVLKDYSSRRFNNNIKNIDDIKIFFI